MGRPVVAVHTVHQTPFAAVLSVRRQTVRRAVRQEGLDRSVRQGHLDLVDRLARRVGAVADPVARIDVPVDALGRPALDAADPQQQHRLELGVAFVVRVVRDHLEPVADELRRPVALLAGLAGRAQVVDRRGNRPRVEVERHRHDLPRARQLGLDEPVGAGADVALDALDPGVRRALVGRVLGLHHGVAGRAAELGRVHHLDALVGRGRQDHQVDRGHDQEGDDDPPRTVEIQIEDGERRWRRTGLPSDPLAPALAVDTPRDQQESQREERRQHQVGQDAHVRVAAVAHQLDGEQRDDQDPAGRGDGGAQQADRAARDRGEEVTHPPSAPGRSPP